MADRAVYRPAPAGPPRVDPDPADAGAADAPVSGRRPAIDAQRCTGCGRCVAACGPHLLSLEVVHWRKRAVLHGEAACTHCSACAVVCPFHAITMRRVTLRPQGRRLQNEARDTAAQACAP